MKLLQVLWNLQLLLLCLSENADDCPKLNYKCRYCAKDNVIVDGCRVCECREILDGETINWEEVQLTSNQANLLLPFDDDKAVLPRAGSTTLVKKWNNLPQSDGMYRIPFFFDDKPVINANARNIIQRAISALSAQTCLRFEPAKIGDQSIIRFNFSRGCVSFIGRTHGVQTIQGCTRSVGDMLKGIMYALGFWSETIRGDRDQYVTLMPINIKPSKLRFTMKLNPSLWDSYNFTYDFSSITHLGPLAYSAYGGPTVLYKNNPTKPVEVNRWAYSLGDLQQIRAMYNCSGMQGVTNSTSCYSLEDGGLTYRGTMNITQSGAPCQRWDAQSPQTHSFKPTLLTGSGLEENYCRNPDMRKRPWCFTTDPSLRWQYCNITICNDSKTLLPLPTKLTSVRGFWSPWSNFSSCSTTCGRGFRYSVRHCIGAKVNSSRCPGDFWRYQSCNYSACPYTDRWHSWEKWSECKAACGNGTYTRVRFCVGKFGKGSCVNDSVETASCSTGRSCPLYIGGACYNSSNPLAFNGTINIDYLNNTCLNWTDTTLNVSAYPNFDLSSNLCRNPDGRRRVPYCFRKRNNRSPCRVDICNAAASWRNWGVWSACSSSCGNGTKTRTRRCKKGHYSEGECTGNVFMTEQCNVTCSNMSNLVIDVLRTPKTQTPMTTSTPSIVECLDIANPRAYRGTRRWSKSGHKCQFWDSAYPWKHKYTNTTLIAREGLLENFCRAPDPGDTKPWCFVVEFIPKKEECDIPYCPYSNNLSGMFADLWAQFLKKFGLVPTATP